MISYYVSCDLYSSCFHQWTCVSQSKTESSTLNEALFFWLQEKEILALKNNTTNQVKLKTGHIRKSSLNKSMGESLSPIQFLFMSHSPWLWAFCLTCLCCSLWGVTRAPLSTARPDVSVCSSWACTSLRPS